MTLVIMAAGLASRYGSTKQLEGVGPNGELLLEYSICDARRAGFTRIVFIIRRAIEAEMREFAKRLPADLKIDFAIQDLTQVPAWFTMPEGRTKPWGTVHALLAAEHLMDHAFAALNADDFYGPAAFVEARAACDVAASVGTAAAIMFPLSATLSPHGSVIRGLGRVEHGQLVELDEVRDIVRDESGLHGRFGSDVRALTGDELASMNFWVFSKKSLSDLRDVFEAFLKTSGQAPASESILPEAVGTLLADGRMTVRALSAPGPWFGLTHLADREGVQRGLRELTAQGVYSSPLWN